MYVTVTLIWYTMRKLTNAWIALAHPAGMQPFSKIVALYHIFSRNWNVFEIRSSLEEGFAPEKLVNALGEASASVAEKIDVAAEVWWRPASVDKALQFLSYMYLEHVNSSLMIKAMYTELKSCDKWVMYRL